MYETVGDYVSPGRRSQELYDKNETAFQREIRHRILNGDIDQDTLVVAITGHGPTIGYEMVKQFGSDIFAHQPYGQQQTYDLTEIKLPQAQTFAKATHDILALKPRVGASTLLDVDFHLFKPKSQWSQNDKLIDSNLLPGPDEVLKLGIKKVLLLEEKVPQCAGKGIYNERKPLGLDNFRTWLNPVFEWLNRLKKDGRLIISEDGIDPRIFPL
jgi:hypothetical protein